MSKSEQNVYESGKTYSIKIDDLKPNPAQPRKHFADDELETLAKDIERNGLIQDISFTQVESQLYIVAGERRYRAYKHLGKSEIQGKYIEGNLRLLALAENIFRANLTTVEYSEAVFALKEEVKKKPQEIAIMLGKAKNTVCEILKIATLPAEIRDDARKKPEITRKDLLKVARKKDPTKQNELYAKLCVQTAPKDNKQKNSLENSQKTVKNAVVQTECKRIENLASTLEATYQKMLEKINKAISDDEKQKLLEAYSLLEIAVKDVLKNLSEVKN